MKLTLNILLLFIISSCISRGPNINPNISVNSRLIRSYDSLFKDQDSVERKTYDISLSIINRSPRPVSFWMMTCSREDNIIINNDYMFFRYPTCTRNFPKLHTLNINDSLVWRVTIYKYFPTEYFTVSTTRFGLIYIDSTQCKSASDFKNFIGDKYYHDIIFWSNPLNLDY
jgi:hypothetical protein